MTNSEILQILKRNPILSKANENILSSLISTDSVQIKEFAAGEEICSPRTTASYVGILLCGSATVLPLSEGGNALLKALCPEDMFGISNLYAEELPFPSVITAASIATVLLIDKEAFKSLIDKDKNALQAYLCILNKKIVYLNRKISTLTAGSAEKRLALYLAENECDGMLISDVSMSALADMLNIGRASLYRALDTLSQNGFIAKQGKTILIHDKNALLNI